MSKRTKQQRLIDVVELYKKTKGYVAVSMDDVAEWAVDNELYPVPTIRDPQALGDAWEARFRKLREQTP